MAEIVDGEIHAPNTRPAPVLGPFEAAKTAVDALLALVYPPRCVLCGGYTHDHLCADCAGDLLIPLPEPICEICGHPRKGNPCLGCKTDPPQFDAARAASLYAGDVKDIIHGFKYHDRPQLAAPLGKLLAAQCEEFRYSLGNLEFDIVTAVPMHPLRKRRRGFNQSERLARVVAAEFLAPYDPSLLVRAHFTRPQVGLKHDARITNMRHAFSIGKVDVVGKTILVIDDVSTTGATLRGCASVLKAAGAKSVYGLTLAAG
ncbi:MAG TPA: ComF family protein [Capsulimonadaceae bacterium]